jgi:hypothetical protein
MGRVLMALGVLMLVGGIGLMVWNAVKPRPTIVAPDTQKIAAEICQAGERHESERGASTYTQGRGYAAPVRHYCVNAAGQRRDVTGEFAARLMASAGDTVNQAMAAVSFSMWPTLLTMGGVGVLILGGFLARRGRGGMHIVIRRR